MQVLVVIALIIIGVLLFELIIFSHEFGHFFTAKLSGVKVNEFSLGMGPKLFGFTKGETQYSFRLFPIGGYCAMEGEDEDSEEPRAFNNAKIWKRMIIIIAGAAMNIILGFLLMFCYAVQADSYSSTTVSQFVPNSFSANSGLQEGDEIVEVNGYSIWNSRDLQFALATLDCTAFDGTSVTVYKEDSTGEAVSLYSSLVKNNDDITDEQIEDLYAILCDGCSKINSAESKASAKQYLDEVYASLNNYMGITDFELPEIEEQEQRYRYSADITVIRDGEKVDLDDVQFFTYYANDEDRENDNKSIAIDFYVDAIEKNAGSVLNETVSETGSMAKMVWTSLVWMVQGKFSFTDLSGPVGIASAVTQVASQGLEVSFANAVNNILFVMILITVNLGIVNMLPFPALDGGRFLFLLIEWIFRKPIPRRVEQIVNSTGLGLLLLFMLIISVKDIWQLITQNLS